MDDDFVDLRPEFFLLGLHLRVPVNIIEKIEFESMDGRLRLFQIFDYWLNNTQEDLWFEQLYTALQRMDRSDLAIIVEQKYMNKSTKGMCHI